MAKKKYPEGVERWELTRQEWSKGHRLNFIIKCPFCSQKTKVDVKAAERDGKKCTKCGGIHYMNGFTGRGFVPGAQAPKSLEEMKAEINLNQEGIKTCYQCETDVKYLFDDGRCSACTRLTPEEVRGEV